MLVTTHINMVRTYKYKITTKYSEKGLVAKEDGVKLLVVSQSLFDHMKDFHPKIGAGTPTILMPHKNKKEVILHVSQKISCGQTKEL